MKRFLTITVLAATLSQAPQPYTYGREQKDPQENKTNKEVTIGKNFKITESDSSVDIRVGNRGLSILESLEGKKKVKIERYSDNDTLYLEDENRGVNEIDNEEAQGSREIYSEDSNSSEDRNRYQEWNDRDSRQERKSRHFKGHWTGFELGFNNYTNSRHSQVIPDDIGYMTLHSGKSMNFNFNFAQVSLGLTKHIGFVTGAGLNWNNYRFDGNNNIIKGANGVIEEFDPGSPVKKSKFSTIYLTLPFLLELQLPVNGNHLNVAAGPVGAVKINSHSKLIYEDGEKVKSSSDFSLNMLRYGATARVGFSNLQFYGTYYMTSLFQTNKGPGYHELYPFEIGLSLSFND